MDVLKWFIVAQFIVQWNEQGFNRLEEFRDRAVDKSSRLVRSVSNPHGFNLHALSACGCVYHCCHVRASSNYKTIPKCQKVSFCQAEIKVVFLSSWKADTWEIRDFHPTAITHMLLSASGRRKPVLMLIRVTTHFCVLSQRTQRWSPCTFIRLGWKGPPAAIPAEASHTGRLRSDDEIVTGLKSVAFIWGWRDWFSSSIQLSSF